MPRNVQSSLLFRLIAVLLLLTLQFGVGSRAGAQDSDTNDPFLWLEEMNGTRALDWVKVENAKTLAVLQQDPHFVDFYSANLKIGQARDRIPTPQIINGRVFNFWQDADHVRGIWRTTSLSNYLRPEPAWKTVLDLDRLAKTENKNWVWSGSGCNSPNRNRCLIQLSEGGEDAVTLREFDLSSGAFVENGFVLPRGKQSAAWVDNDTLLVSREWEPGMVTASGYAYDVKMLKRGQALSDAVEVFSGTKSDVSVNIGQLMDGHNHRAVLVNRGVSFFQSEHRLLTPKGLRKLEMPLKAGPRQIVAGRVLVDLDEPWKNNGTTFPAGAVVSVDFDAMMRDPEHLRATLVYKRGARDVFEGATATRDHLLVTTLENVRGRAGIYTPVAGGGWKINRLALPDNSAITLGTADRYGTRAFLNVTGFLSPTTSYLVDTASGKMTVAKRTPERFDASGDEVEQHTATSKDGTKIPYFMVHPKNMKLDGNNPTILEAYGGFTVTSTPNYNTTYGKLWYERGGTYVLANIRGGGEFGPAWHEAGLKTHRQRIYDDFAAVGEDLIARKITSPQHLGIKGGSNGGLLVGVEMTQHPDLWNAVDIEVPLLDMLRFEKIQAGASWVGEYGSVSIPAERTFLASISPYNNLKPGVKYPEPLIWTTTKDDRVGPQHARKFAAKMATLGDPYYFYEVIEGGHGAGANIQEGAFTRALVMTYFTSKLMQ
jgi:prolyl oligopeptidase